jgi:hypothetical protein
MDILTAQAEKLYRRKFWSRAVSARSGSSHLSSPLVKLVAFDN